MFAITGSQKMLDPDIEANGRKGARSDLLVRLLKTDFEIPFISPTCHCKGADLRAIRKWPMKADLYHSDVLDSESVARKPYAVTVSRKLDAGKMIGVLEPGISRFSAGFESPKEGLK